VSWWYSAILVVAVFFLAFTLVVNAGDADDSRFSGTVIDAYTGEPIDDVQVSTASTTTTTDGDGRFALQEPVDGTITLTHEHYESAEIPAPNGDERVAVEMRPTTLSGVVTNTKTDEPIVGATVKATGPDNTTVTTVTDAEGRYLLIDVPADAQVAVVLEGFSEISKDVGQNVTLDFDIRPDVVTGLVVDQDGQPVPDATVQLGGTTATTGPDGRYQLAGIIDESEIVVRKAGYSEVAGPLPDEMVFDATLERIVVNAIYVSAIVAGDDELWYSLLDLVERTELNAIVLDIKDSSGLIRYDTQVPMAIQIGAKDVQYDIAQRLAEMRERGIYAIARQVIFEDPLLASARPDLAIHDVTTGGPWTTWDGLAWVNAHEREIWQYNVDIALEAAAAGFDEIQMDYIRFPTDGVLENADYGAEFADEPRTDAIVGFLTQMQAALAPTGAYLGVDIFGFTLWDEGDGGIGQQLELIAPLVDFICPMIYPSHFAEGELGFDIPNDHPYEVILWSLQSGAERVSGIEHKFRPWLQDFSYGVGMDYGPAEVRAQIDAAEEFGAHGWMLWNAASEYQESALAAEE
jgi:hypothetical protein